MFKWTEVKSWAKLNDFDISKTAKVDEYFWEDKVYYDLRSLVIDLWNRKTNNAYLDYQKSYRADHKITQEF